MKSSNGLRLLIVAVLLVVVSIGSVVMGSTDISLSEVILALRGGGDEAVRTIL